MARKTPQQVPLEDETWDTALTYAEHLGMHPRTVRNFIAEGRIPAYRVGNRAIRINRREADAALIERIPAGRVA